jgi:hypothetical protein
VGLDISKENDLPFLGLQILTHKNMNEEFIRVFADKLNWYDICSNICLSEEFLLEFSERIPWGAYLNHFPVSFTIMKKFIAKTSFQSLDYVATCYLTDLQLKEIQRILDFKNLFIE